MRTLKEQCLYLRQFRDLDEAREIIGEFIERYNNEWIVERLGYRRPPRRVAIFSRRRHETDSGGYSG